MSGLTTDNRAESHALLDQGQQDNVQRDQGQSVVARALWYVKPGVAELRPETLAPPRPGEARVKTLFSAISRGTERLVAFGNVPASEWPRMRAPLQAGDFPFPVKYGYSATGEVTSGPQGLVGRTVFCLHPHQDIFDAPESMLVEVPAGIPPRRATLAANMETALNAHWDAGTSAGDSVLVVGAGIVGLLTAYLAKRLAGPDVVITDIDNGRMALAGSLASPSPIPTGRPADRRLVFHTSASAAGLQSAIDSAAFEGRIIEMSWYGAAPVTINLGGAFHAKRLQIVSSQVGHVAPAMRATVTPRERLRRALSLLDDPALDGLVADDIAFDDAARMLPKLLTDTHVTALPVIRYRD